MKKMIATILACTLVSILLVGVISAAAGSPNIGNPNQTAPGTCKPYVQCQPSYNDGGQHAAQGHYSIWEISLDGQFIHDGGQHYTAWGTSINDTRILKTQSVFNSIYSGHVTFQYGFTWVPHGSSIWPVSIPGSEVTE